MLLNELIAHLVPGSEHGLIEISGLTLDSRWVVPGDLFFSCVSGTAGGDQQSAHVTEALAKGAVAVLKEMPLEPQTKITYVRNHDDCKVPVIEVPALRRHVGTIAANFYQHPSANMLMVGVTGTNGKTAYSQFLATVLNALGQTCGVVGTNGVGFMDDLRASALTTPDPISLQQYLSQLCSAGTKAVVIEASSQGLDQERLLGVAFDYGAFTNLTHDHLDYHKTMSHYAAAKAKLFTETGLHTAILNLDDPFGRKWAETLADRLAVYGYGSQKNSLKIPYLRVSEVKVGAHSISATVETPWGTGQLNSPILGRFNIENLMAVLATLCAMGFSFERVLEQFAVLKAVPGRMQTFGGKAGKPLVIVDYAHTPDALEKVLIALREHRQGNLWCVMGCGGDRDRYKRRLMGRIAERYSDTLVVTNDNPRFEDPQAIVKEIIVGLLCPWAVKIEYDRKAAIAYAIQNAGENDMVLVAGKGHEITQMIGEETLSFSDGAVVRAQLATLSAMQP